MPKPLRSQPVCTVLNCVERVELRPELPLLTGGTAFIPAFLVVSATFLCGRPEINTAGLGHCRGLVEKDIVRRGIRSLCRRCSNFIRQTLYRIDHDACQNDGPAPSSAQVPGNSLRRCSVATPTALMNRKARQ